MKTLQVIGTFLLGILLSVGLSLVLAVFVMLFWNWVIPDIFNLPELTYSQSFGISVLCGLLFNKQYTINKTTE